MACAAGQPPARCRALETADAEALDRGLGQEPLPQAAPHASHLTKISNTDLAVTLDKM